MHCFYRTLQFGLFFMQVWRLQFCREIRKLQTVKQETQKVSQTCRVFAVSCSHWGKLASTTCTVGRWYDRTKYLGMLDCKIQRNLMSAWTQAQTLCESSASNMFFCLLLGHLYAAWSAWDFKVELSCTNYSSDKQLELFNVKPHNSQLQASSIFFGGLLIKWLKWMRQNSWQM